MNFLFVIPARGGSKGIPGKNIKPLVGKPLIYYSLEYARQFTTDENICISTDAIYIADAVRSVGYALPFLRPAYLATDVAGTFAVLQHALDFYEKKGKTFDAVVLLQPTSPFREVKHFEESARLFNKNIDMVVSVTEAASNPYFNLFEENNKGFLKISKGSGQYLRRQDVPKVFEYNGSIYIINTDAVRRNNSVSELERVVKYVMAAEYAIDLDTPADWSYAEFMHAHLRAA